jgi:hypothetical protein
MQTDVLVMSQCADIGESQIERVIHETRDTQLVISEAVVDVTLAFSGIGYLAVGPKIR